MKLNLQGWQKTHELCRKNVGPSCSTWHQAATMYLPSTSYTGEYMKWSCGQWIRRKEHSGQLRLPWLDKLQLPCLDSFGCHGWTNCSCHAWTTAVAMYNQMWLQCLNNRGWQVWTNLCGMVGPLHVPCWTNYSCHAMTNCYHDRRLLRWNHIGKHLMASFTVAGKRYCR